MKNFLIVFILTLISFVSTDNSFCDKTPSYCENDQVHITCMKIDKSLKPNPEIKLFKNLELDDDLEKNITAVFNAAKKKSDPTDVDLIWDEELEEMAEHLQELGYEDEYSKICYKINDTDNTNDLDELSFSEKYDSQSSFANIFPKFIAKYGKPDAKHEIPIFDDDYKYFGCSLAAKGVTGNLTLMFKCIFSEVKVDLEDDPDDIDCKKNELECDNGKECFDPTSECDGYPDCSDGSDEDNCNIPSSDVTCEANMILCANGKLCIAKKFKCDQHEDCADGSDEANCNSTHTVTACTGNRVLCADKSKCIPFLAQCDSITHCQDKSDEKDCSCKADEFECARGRQCIPSANVCDSTPACTDRSDEDPDMCKKMATTPDDDDDDDDNAASNLSNIINYFYIFVIYFIFRQ